MGAVGFLVLTLLAVMGLWAGWDRLAPRRDIEAPRQEAPAADMPAQEGPTGEIPAGEAPEAPAAEIPVVPGHGGAWRLQVPEGGAAARLLDDWSRRGERFAERAVAAIPVPPLGDIYAAAAGEQARFADNPRPRLAIVIDDWGYPWAAADDFLALPAPLTVAVIPHLPLSEEHARKAEARGHQVLLHLPMQPLNDGVPLEPGTVRVDMSPVEVLRILDRALASVPRAVGVNNHMGSRATADPAVMHPLLADLKRRGLFFLDSATTPRSVAREAAGAHGLPLAVNRVFLDSNPTEEAVAERIQAAMNLALRTGEAVAIGHVRPETYRALARLLPEVEAAGIELVHVSELARRPRARYGEGRPLARGIARHGRLNGAAAALAAEPGFGQQAERRAAEPTGGRPAQTTGSRAAQPTEGRPAQPTDQHPLQPPEHRVARERGDGR